MPPARRRRRSGRRAPPGSGWGTASGCATPPCRSARPGSRRCPSGLPDTVPRGSSWSGSPTWKTPASAPISMGAPPRRSWRSSLSWATWSRMSLRRTVWGSQPSPRCAARRNAAREDPPTQIGGLGCWTGRGDDAEIVRRPTRAGQGGVLVGERRPPWRRWPRRARPPLLEGRPEEVELLVDVPGTHADDHPSTRQHVQGGELLGGSQRVPLGRDVDVAHEPDPGGDPRQPSQGGDRVVPRRAHGLRPTGAGWRCGRTPPRRRTRSPRPGAPPGRARRGRIEAPSPPRRSWTVTGSAAGCRRRPSRRG